MVRVGHFAIPVRDVARSREWYVSNFGLEVEIDVPERMTVGLKDDGDCTLFLEQVAGDFAPSCKFAFEVADVESKYRELSARGVKFEKAPQKLYWGYGAELRDPDGYLVSVWDERSMRERGSAPSH
jgi:predicted enzyme related to lactoylglutathione lyase